MLGWNWIVARVLLPVPVLPIKTSDIESLDGFANRLYKFVNITNAESMSNIYYVSIAAIVGAYYGFTNMGKNT